jgi:RNA polymerase sigma factor (sigma-70 family)
MNAANPPPRVPERQTGDTAPVWTTCIAGSGESAVVLATVDSPDNGSGASRVTHITIVGRSVPTASLVLRDVKRHTGGMDDAALLRRISRQDRSAFDELYRRTSPWLLVRLRRRCADDELVAEVLQDTYLAIWRAAGSFAGQQDTTAGWLWTIASHRLVDAFRRRARHTSLPPAVAGPEQTAPAAEDVALFGHVSGELEQALLTLPPELRQVLKAMVLDGLTARETSLLLGVAEGTVKTRARRARAVLREALA